MAQPDVTKQQPIGYWLKYADKVITEHVDRVLSDNGFTRLRWQIINSVYRAGTITKSDLFDTMQAFIDARQLDELIDGFVKEGWLIRRGEGDGAQLAITDAGKDKREAVFKLQSEVRRRAMRGITEQEYTMVNRRATARGEEPGMSNETPGRVTPPFRELDVSWHFGEYRSHFAGSMRGDRTFIPKMNHGEL